MTQFDSLFKNKSDLPKPSPTSHTTAYFTFNTKTIVTSPLVYLCKSKTAKLALCQLPLLEPFA